MEKRKTKKIGRETMKKKTRNEKRQSRKIIRDIDSSEENYGEEKQRVAVKC